MRFFHLADLHIGKKVNGYSMIDDQRVLLNQVAEAIREQKPDALILAGDIYDRRNPPIEAITLFDAFASRVVLEEGVPILAIGGNHDGGERLGFSNAIQAKAGFHLVGNFEWPLPKVRLTTGDGDYDIYLMAYADLALIHTLVPDTQGLDYAEAMDYLMKQLTLDTSVKNILVAHGVVTGSEPLETCDSERMLSIGGTEFWQSEALSDFDYVALGHLHRAQKIASERIQYAGSLMQYSFSEENQQKIMLDVSLESDGVLSCQHIALHAQHHLMTIRGHLEELLGVPTIVAPHKEDYLRVVLEDEGALIEPMQRLKSVYPNIMLLERAARAQIKTQATPVQMVSSKRSPLDLFDTFYLAVTEEEASEAMRQKMMDIFETLQKEEP